MHEYEEIRICGMEDVTVVALGGWGRTLVDRAIEAKHPHVKQHYLRSVRSEVQEIEVKVCPFEGLVIVRHHRGETDWECPLCRSEHRGRDDE